MLAAGLVGGSALLVSGHRKREADRERWWTQYVWLMSSDADRLPFDGRSIILGRTDK